MYIYVYIIVQLLKRKHSTSKHPYSISSFIRFFPLLKTNTLCPLFFYLYVCLIADTQQYLVFLIDYVKHRNSAWSTRGNLHLSMNLLNPFCSCSASVSVFAVTFFGKEREKDEKWKSPSVGEDLVLKMNSLTFDHLF